MDVDLDFNTGKLIEVARHERPDRTKEYRLLAVVLVAALVPYALLGVYQPLATSCLVLFAAYFQVLASFATSANTDTSHHIRFLLSGSNPISMTGGSSLIFGAVDAIVDWREDAGERRRRPIGYWVMAIYKFLMTPIGLVLMALEYAWDAILMRRPGLIIHKWTELFSLANYHNLICPEKSNDIFYADLAFARYQDDPYLYQWNRLRALVFELEHYRIDFEHGVGVPETNLFWQDELTAYQTLKRLRVEEIEEQLAVHYAAHPEALLVPPTLGRQLVNNARPLHHYLRIARRLNPPLPCEWRRKLVELLRTDSADYAVWHVLRLFDVDSTSITSDCSNYITDEHLQAMVQAAILERPDPVRAAYQFTVVFRESFGKLLEEFFVPVSPSRLDTMHCARLPTYLRYRGEAFEPASVDGSRTGIP